MRHFRDRLDDRKDYGEDRYQTYGRKAKALRLLTVEERRRRGQRSLTNVVRFLCRKWRTEANGAPQGCRHRRANDAAPGRSEGGTPLPLVLAASLDCWR